MPTINLALVIRADGTVPFDEDHPYKDLILSHLADSGHVVEQQADGSHKILSGPYLPKAKPPA